MRFVHVCAGDGVCERQRTRAELCVGTSLDGYASFAKHLNRPLVGSDNALMIVASAMVMY